MLKILAWPHPALATVCPAFDFANPVPSPMRLEMEMEIAMRSGRGVGLAAPQVGILTRMFVIRSGAGSIACFNPILTAGLGARETLPEGCLSFPGEFPPVRRWARAAVRFQNRDGEPIDMVLVGQVARCFQHELDHLDGITIYDRKGATK